MLKAADHEWNERVAKAVLDDAQRPAVFNVGIYPAYSLVAAHEYRIGINTLGIVKEQLALCLPREIGIVIIGGILILGLIVGECIGVEL